MGGIAPITAFKAFVQRDPISAVYEPAGVHRIALFNERELSTWQHKHMEVLQLTLDSMHKRVSEFSRKKNEAAWRRHELKKGVTPVNFQVGDFVLSGHVTRRENKLILHWKGPYRVVSTLNGWTYEVQELVEPFGIITRHVTRLKFFRENIWGKLKICRITSGKQMEDI